MDKSWNQLSDRCNLFYTAPSGLFKELLNDESIKEVKSVLTLTKNLSD